MGLCFGLSSTISDTDKRDNALQIAYFNTINQIQKKRSQKSLHSQSNIQLSLQKTDFVTTLISPQRPIKGTSEDWYQYFYFYLYKESNRSMPWASDVIELLENEYFVCENKYQSMFFFEEFQIKTEPAILKHSEDIVNSMHETHHSNLLSNGLRSKDYSGSFISTSSHSPALFPEDIQNQYNHSRSRVKEYIDVFCQHILNKDHPVNIIAEAFCQAFSAYVNNEVEELRQLPNDNSISYKEKLFNKALTITKYLQKFIVRLHIVLKLFYCKTVDYHWFANEKDELVSSVTSLLFQNDSLYQAIYDLYEISEQAMMSNLSDKFNSLRNIQPEDLRIDPRYCLNKTTLNYQREFLRKSDLCRKSTDSLTRDAELVREIDNKIEKGVYYDSSNANDQISYQLNVMENNSKLIEEKFISLSENEISINEIDSNKVELTKINLQSKRTAKTEGKGVNTKLSKFTIEEDNKVVGFKSAINMLEAIKQYRTPFEKMIVITKIGEKIIESVNFFWKDLKSFLSPGFLTIDADNTLSIFIYLLIKSKMSEIAIHLRIIKQFTTTTTKLSSIGYYYSTLDASVVYIEETDKNEMLSKLKDSNAKDNIIDL